MNREITQEELLQLDNVIIEINKKLLELKKLIETGSYDFNKQVCFHLSFRKKKEKDNKLYLLRNLDFDFEKYIIPRLLGLFYGRLKLHVINDDLSGAIVDCDDGISYSKDYETQFKITIKR